ncbi:MAG: leucyl aminopeptidase [Nitrospinae bacterium RIFCSPLOWO2_02_FULL_39_110]|nr:MAG: leucyl aminopeptidase [Nitrospinae bacterium RIFCSPHIGHO2_02_FULL_39_82]OGW05421.1 MAG: leucyl aminopeptidase [Nitrospinae bacterium RIFCSPLOWO2_02_39_17]OGW07362.1 MAG: leucyl aminopeptidase [Nitrospinae bacterium RIFCSPLOWO2_02_FULL_39_110]
MKIYIKAEAFEKHKTGCLVVGSFESKKTEGLVKVIDKRLNGLISKLFKDKDFEGKLKQTRLIYTQGKIPAERVLLVGLGKEKEFTIEKLRQASGGSSRAVKDLGLKKISTSLANPPSVSPLKKGGKGGLSAYDISKAVTEGAILSLYDFTSYRTEKREEIKRIDEIVILIEKENKEIKKGLDEGIKISEAVYIARDMINHPANTATPTYLAEQAKRIAKKSGIRCKILDRADMERLKMGALLAVARGSDEPPKFIIMEYNGGKKGEPPVLIAGKGLTFDSGGISIKPSEKMEEMKHDMAGGAAAICAIKAAADLKLPVNVVSLIPATENMPSGKADKPGDVVKAMSGKTIEVISTDAEGRMILADALTYGERYKPKAVIDLATLTGAVIIALGYHATGLLGNDKNLIEAIKKAGEKSGERVWELPLWEEYEEQNKSDIADVKNVGGRGGGTITAAAFLKKFAGKFKWAHLDIAGTVWEYNGKPYVPKGAVGVGVRLLVEYLKNL